MHRKLALGIGIATAAVITTGGVALAAEDHSHPATAAVSSHEGDHDHHEDSSGREDHDADAAATAANIKITADQAVKIALQAVPGARITSTELEDEHGAPAWEVELTPANGPHRELTINAQTGKLINNKADQTSTHDHDED